MDLCLESLSLSILTIKHQNFTFSAFFQTSGFDYSTTPDKRASLWSAFGLIIKKMFQREKLKKNRTNPCVYNVINHRSESFGGSLNQSSIWVDKEKSRDSLGHVPFFMRNLGFVSFAFPEDTNS
ncbi:CLUMA_CG011115, isoform A [Clunio marinus]|uniref:CLUMA_CG011115, isoform A n=1 Tax=Clunio marinus TaxID=568069 RepID=A0A1J1IBS7_9DIPT|nr:CLUMA_CG011115, isoform A [Clunio marinus]